MTFESPLILESGKIFVESAILGFGIRNSAQGIWNLTDDWNTESQFHRQRVEPSACIVSLRASVWKKMKGKVVTGANSLPLPFERLSSCTVKPRLTATSLLRPLLLAAWRKPPYIFFQKRPSLIRPNFWPVGDRINGVPQYLESEIYGVESRIQGCLGFLSWF